MRRVVIGQNAYAGLASLSNPPYDAGARELVGNLVEEKLAQVVEKLAQTRGVEFAILVPQGQVAGACNSDSQ